MKGLIKENWFHFTVIVLLVMCYIRLGEIKENTFYIADILSEVESNTENTYFTLDEMR